MGFGKLKSENDSNSWRCFDLFPSWVQLVLSLRRVTKVVGSAAVARWWRTEQSLAELGYELQLKLIWGAHKLIGAVKAFTWLTRAEGRSARWRSCRKMPRWRKGRATWLGDLKKSGTVRRRLGSRSWSPRSDLLRATFAFRKGRRKKKIRRS